MLCLTSREMLKNKGIQHEAYEKVFGNEDDSEDSFNTLGLKVQVKHLNRILIRPSGKSCFDYHY